MMSERRGSRVRWMKHYSSAHDILLVGEGDFSFSRCLGMSFESAANMVATSLDSHDELINKYKNAKANLLILKVLGATLLHGVNATQMMNLPDLRWKKFHRIVYNFPHAGFFGKEDNPDMITMHRNLVRGFLWNARSMLWLDGEIHISHKITAPFDRWRIEDLASECSLLCIGQDEFRIEEYPEYRNKRGSGSRADEPFPLGACRTFKFKLWPRAEQNLMPPQMFPTPPVVIQPQTPVCPFPPLMFPTPAVGIQYQPPGSPFAFYDVNSSNDGPALHNYTSECQRIFGGYLNHAEETFGDTSYDVRRSVEEALRLGYEMYMKEASPGRPLSGFTEILEELLHLSISRSEGLKLMLLFHQKL